MRGNPSCPLSERSLQGDRRLDRAPPEGRETSDVVGKHLLTGRVPWISSADDPIPTFSRRRYTRAQSNQFWWCWC